MVHNFDSQTGNLASENTPENLQVAELRSETETAGERELAELDQEALKALLSSGLIVGPDPQIIAQVQAAPDPIVQLADEVELEAQVAEIYRQIIARAPEHQVQPSLERVTQCLDLLGNPQDTYRAIHITGTNGKTSTARIIEALLRERGLRTGRFTSPHLSSVRERIALNGQAISAADFIATWQDVRDVIELVDARSVANGGPRLSFFEVFTVMAYSAFAMAPIDVAVVEVGMGGLWDATNVIDADVCVLTPIALDHQQWLGESLSEIAQQKLGILSPGKILVTAVQAPELSALIAETVREKAGQLLVAKRDFFVLDSERAVGGQMFSLRTPAAVYEDIPLAMFGQYQAQNAATALMAVEAFFGGTALPAQVVEHALMTTTSPGRMEVVKTSPLIIVDAAHNPAGAQVTAQTLQENFPGPRVAVYSAMADKDIEAVLGELEPIFAEIVLTQMPGDRAAELADLTQIAQEVFGAERVKSELELADAIAVAVDAAETVDPDALAPAHVVVLGSIQLVAAARELLGAKKPDCS